MKYMYYNGTYNLKEYEKVLYYQSSSNGVLRISQIRKIRELFSKGSLPYHTNITNLIKSQYLEYIDHKL